MKKKNPRLLILVGAPGSGKSDFAKYLVRSHLNWVRVCRDDFRRMQFSQSFLLDEMEKTVSEMMFAAIERLLNMKLNVIVDGTHTKAAYLDKYIEYFGHMADIEFKVFEESFDELLERCNKRMLETGKKVTQKALTHHMEGVSQLKDNYDFSLKPCEPRLNETIQQDQSLQKAIICDLDETLVLSEGRGGPDVSNQGKYRINTVAAEILSLYRQSDHHVLLLSGREEKHRTATVQFLEKQGIAYHELWMRPKDNHVEESVLKRFLYITKIENKYSVSLVLEDRNQVVDMWRTEVQLPCFQVFYGSF